MKVRGSTKVQLAALALVLPGLGVPVALAAQVPAAASTLTPSTTSSAVPSPEADDLAGAMLPAYDIALVGHRGLAPGYPENTLTAFRHVVDELGVGIIELDLRSTADGEVVILHDETVDRTTGGAGAVEEMTLEQVKALDAGSYAGTEFADEKIPTYEEVLVFAQETGVMLLLDIKESPNLDKERVVRLTEEYDLSLQVVVGARSTEDLTTFQDLNPNLRTLGFIPEPGDAAAFINAGADIIRLWPDWIHGSTSPVCAPGGDEAPTDAVASCLVEVVKGTGTPVWTTAGTADRGELLELVELGVNGILTDDPAVLSDLLEDIDEARNSGG